MKFTETHEWIEHQEGVGRVGISVYAQKELGDIVYVELPKVGKQVKKGEPAAVLESTKAAADVYAPVSGTILSVNTALNDKPELINTSPEKEGWIFTLSMQDPSECNNLIDRGTYQNKVS